MTFINAIMARHYSKSSVLVYWTDCSAARNFWPLIALQYSSTVPPGTSRTSVPWRLLLMHYSNNVHCCSAPRRFSLLHALQYCTEVHPGASVLLMLRLMAFYPSLGSCLRRVCRAINSPIIHSCRRTFAVLTLPMSVPQYTTTNDKDLAMCRFLRSQRTFARMLSCLMNRRAGTSPTLPSQRLIRDVSLRRHVPMFTHRTLKTTGFPSTSNFLQHHHAQSVLAWRLLVLRRIYANASWQWKIRIRPSTWLPFEDKFCHRRKR